MAAGKLGERKPPVDDRAQRAGLGHVAEQGEVRGVRVGLHLGDGLAPAEAHAEELSHRGEAGDGAGAAGGQRPAASDTVRLPMVSRTRSQVRPARVKSVVV